MSWRSKLLTCADCGWHSFFSQAAKLKDWKGSLAHILATVTAAKVAQEQAAARAN